MKKTPINPLFIRIWRWVRLMVWALIAVAYLAFFLTDLRLDFDQLQNPCKGTECNYLAISQTEVDVMESWGLTLRKYSVIMNGATVLAVTVSWVLGILILWRQGASRIGWSVSLALVVMPIAMISDADNLASVYPGLLIPSFFLSIIGFSIFLLYLYLFPNGRFYPRWAYFPFTVTLMFFTLYLSEFVGLITITSWVLRIAILATIALIFLAGGFQIQRYHRDSTSLERQQTKWVTLGILILLMSFPVWFLLFSAVLQIPPGLPRFLASVGGWVFLMSAFSALPVTMAIAILRYRLWDIDLVLRRTLQYALLTGILVIIYFGSVVALQTMITAVGGQQPAFVTVVSTLTIAALFSPLRTRIQNLIDRRFNRTKYSAMQALAQFTETVRDEVDMDKLIIALLDLAGSTMQPSKVSLWLIENPGRQSKTGEQSTLR